MKLKHLRWGAGALFAGVALLVACDGQNLFDPNQNPFAEPRVSVTAPDGAFAGDTMVVAVGASAANNISTITLSVRGAAVKDTTLTVTAARTVNTSVKVALPSVLTDTLVYVAAIATDINGLVSKVKADTVTVVGPPAITSVTAPDSLKTGTTATVQIHAFGSRRITQFDITMRGAFTKDTTIFVSPPLNSVTQSLSISLPAAVSDTAVRLGIVAKDISGLASAPSTTVLPLAIAAPVAVLQAPVPLSVAPGGTLDLSVRGTAMRGVAKLGVVLSGAMNKDTSVDVSPAQTDVTLPISIRVPGDVNGSNIAVSVYAIDNAGTRSAPATSANVAINAGLPVIVSVSAVDSVRAGQIVDVRVVAQGVRPITQLVVHFRGAANADQTVPVVPSSTNVTKDVQIQLPVDVSDTLLTITAVATDEGNQLSALTASATKIVKVTDVTAPTVTATPNTTGATAGAAIQIRVQARDNVALKQVGYAVVNPAGDTIGATPTLATTAGAVKDTTFSFTVPSTLTPQTVRVLGIAVDASGRRGYSTATTVIVSDSAAPTVTFVAPAPNATLPLNDSVRVQLHIVDQTGIKSVTLSGQSTRVDSLGPTRIIQRFTQKSIVFTSPLPRDTIITRYLNAIPDSISEPVALIVVAADSLANTSTTSTTILVGGPRVELRQPVNNTQVVPGGTLSLQAFALDRSAGIDSVQVSFGGALPTVKFTAGCAAPATGCIPATGVTNHPDSVVINFDQPIPAAQPTGTITITTTAWNHNLIAGTASPVTIQVTTTAVGDTARPQVRFSVAANDRVELSDTITVDAAAQDVGSAGIRRIGLRVTATPAGGAPAPATIYLDTVYPGAGRTGLQQRTFKFTLADLGFTELNLVKLPKGITLDVQAFAIDASGNCGANVTNTLATIQCDSVNVVPQAAPPTSGSTWWYFAKNTSGASKFVTAVPGFGRALQQGSVIADILVDTTSTHPRMFLANQNNNRIDVLELSDSTFSSTPISVGSEPWGMFMNNAAVGIGAAGPKRLIVANSGGTNISFVDADVAPHGQLEEKTDERLFTPNEVLFNIGITASNGFLRYTVSIMDFSDRPQFVAQDANGTILYSTKPTGAAPDGSIRYLTTTPVVPNVSRPDSRLLFNRDAILATDGIAIAYIDSIVVTRPGVGNDAIALFDHLPGFPGSVITSGVWENIDSAAIALRAQGSDIFESAGSWDRNAVGLSDTTYIAASGNRQFVGFGEGGVGPFARIWLWRCGPVSGTCPIGAPGPATTGSISDNITVQDLLGNASERVVGLGLNNDGQLGAARGANYAYFFSNNAQLEGDLRLQGIFGNGVAGGGGGVALHPNHTTTTTCSENEMAFIATVNRSIKIVDTVHFRERGEILIRDNIVGPLRAALPLASENAGLVGTQDEILVKLYGVTGAGKADIINVRRRDLTDMTGCP